MSDSEFRTSVSVPLDDDGFLRRECPTCEREFKWFPAGEDEGAEMDPAGYYCPYCGVQAADGWLTKAQAELARATVAKQFVDPMLGDFTRKLNRQSSGGFLRIGASHEPSPEPPELTEDNDMRHIDFPCHPTEPLKVREDWSGPVHCLICGADAPS